MTDSFEQPTGRVRRTWVVGLTLYLLLGAIAGVFSPIYISWFGTLFILICVLVHIEQQGDDPILIWSAIGQLVCTILTGLLLTPSTSAYRWAFDLALFLGIFGPLFVAAYGLRHSRFRPVATGTPND